MPTHTTKRHMQTATLLASLGNFSQLLLTTLHNLQAAQDAGTVGRASQSAGRETLRGTQHHGSVWCSANISILLSSTCRPTSWVFKHVLGNYICAGHSALGVQQYWPMHCNVSDTCVAHSALWVMQHWPTA